MLFILYSALWLTVFPFTSVHPVKPQPYSGYALNVTVPVPRDSAAEMPTVPSESLADAALMLCTSFIDISSMYTVVLIAVVPISK